MALAWQPVHLIDDRDGWQRGDPAGVIDLPSLDELIHRPAWHSLAACNGEGTAKWFPEHGEPWRPAVAVCDGCPVREECRTVALADPDTEGIWAGTTRSTRRAMRKAAA